MAPTALEKAERDRESAKTNITWLESKLTLHVTAPLTKIQAELFLIRAKDYNTKVVEIHEKIVHCHPPDMDPHNHEYISLLDRLSAIQCGFEEIKQSLPSTAASTSSTSTGSTDIRLPRLTLPTFDGNLNDWMSFRDMFTAAVHDNTSLSKAQKFTYLKSTLTGEAAKQIKSMTLSDANYDIAWMQLKERYQNDREILFSILRKFMSQHSIGGNSAIELRSLIDVSKECIRSLEVLLVPVKHWDAILLFHIFQKLDQTTKELWETSLKTSTIPSLQDFMDFLEQRSRALAAAGPKIRNAPAKPDTHFVHRRVNQVHHAQASTQCKVCSSQNHPIFQCSKFREMSVHERSEAAKKFSLCTNCLRDNHSISQCPSKCTCQICNGRHHTLLHRKRPQTNINSTKESEPLVLTHHSHDKTKIHQTLLATALIRVKDRCGQLQLCRAFLDGGSTSSFISESCIQKLGLTRKRANAEVTGLASTSVASTKGIVSVLFNSHFSSTEQYAIQALILPKITGRLPIYPCDPTVWSHLQNLELADPQYYQPADVDILLGADIFWNLLLDGRKTGPSNTPTAIRSTLGWLIAGNLDSIASTVVAHYTTTELDNLLQKFWELETLTTARTLTAEEEKCEQHFLTTHRRDENGKFIVQLPFKSTQLAIGSSREIAIRRLKSLERRLIQKPAYESQYIDFMKEYIALGHMEVVPAEEIQKTFACYIPHHFVLKDSSTTTKFRVVFDASCKTTSGVSLNDTLLVGPTIQDNLMNILMRFRLHIVAFTADVAKMYRQILVTPEDANMQRIVWRERPSDPIKDFRLLTVTYGTASAPYLATKVLQQLAQYEKQSLPLASKIAVQDFYVDDLMSGSSTVQEGLEIQRQLLELTRRGGLSLRKWTSNSQELLEALPVELRETNSLLPLDSDPTIKTLGVFWNPATDEFLFKIHLQSPPPGQSESLTKRILLSEMAKLFDPMGWLAPVIIKAKILIQQLWKLNIGWDDALPATIQLEWWQYKNNLFDIENIKINRCIIPSSYERIRLAGFADASEKAYAAVVYLCLYSTGADAVISQVTSKTRVAPTKQISLPRLELCAAVLLAQLLTAVITAHKLKYDSVLAYSDSTVALAWIQAHPSRWKTFVANRVTEIQNSLSSENWRHVSGTDNPADCASRGINPNELLNHPLWWNGPAWLKSNSHERDAMLFEEDDLVLEEERRTITCCATHVKTDTTLLFRYSTLKQLKRVTAWIFRFCYNCRAKSNPKENVKIKTGPLTAVELERALFVWIKIAQNQEFHTEIICLSKGEPLPHKSRILSLNPFLDAESLLRVGGRLRHAPLPIEQKHPLLLPRHHRLTKLIIINEHIVHMHAGPQHVLSTITRRFWIIAARDAIRHQIRSCVICTKNRAALMEQFMGDLPASRITPSRPFLNCGIDYAGAFQLKPIAPRSTTTIKAYLAIFVCFATRAVHLEVVSSLSTDAFLAALRRFISRRGRPNNIHSDCGTNFVGANHQLKEMTTLLKSSKHNEKISNALSDDGIIWHFNPPGAPHFGGLWEAGVKSVKFHLHRVVGNVRLTFEEMTTVMTQIEAVLNSRPLTASSTDPNDMTALTPGHFLIGAQLSALPEPDLTTSPQNRLSRWQLLQKLYQHFWRRWSNEFISRLQQRPKWMKTKKQIELNNLVLIKDDNLPPLKWKLGRVLHLHPGADGITRVVTLKTSDGELKRPIVKLCLLPIEPKFSETNIVHEAI